MLLVTLEEALRMGIARGSADAIHRRRSTGRNVERSIRSEGEIPDVLGSGVGFHALELLGIEDDRSLLLLKVG